MFRRWIRLNAVFLIRVLQKFIPDQPSYAIVIFTGKEGSRMGAITVGDDAGTLDASVSFLDEHGHETTADDVPQWTSSDEAVASVAASEDGLSATVTVNAPGVALIDVVSTNDDGSTAQAQGTITVQPGDAVIGDVNFAGATGDGGEEEPPPVEEPPVE